MSFLLKNIALKPINEIITETEVKLNAIYFEFNKSNITNQGALELDKLVAIMKAYPEMNILVKSHTDSKGNAAYNLKLSERRAQSTVQYLISKGIDKSRLSAEGMGSTDLFGSQFSLPYPHYLATSNEGTAKNA